MAYRYTNTEKWQDSWFVSLKQLEMLLFMYLCDNCDIAGFIEVNSKRWANDLNSSIDTIQGALKGLERGFIYSNSKDCIFLRNFLKHQKNLPLNENNKAHLGILKRFDLYSYKFEIQNVNEFIEVALKGLSSPSGIGNGIGNGIGKLEGGMGETKIQTWKTDFSIYQKELREAWKRIVVSEYILEREKYHPNLNIKLTLEKACIDFWATEKGWQNKKAKKSNEINWKLTFNNSLTEKMNQVWKPKEIQEKGKNPEGFKYPAPKDKTKQNETDY